jgi:hypothetical protein
MESSLVLLGDAHDRRDRDALSIILHYEFILNIRFRPRKVGAIFAPSDERHLPVPLAACGCQSMILRETASKSEKLTPA